MDDNVWSERRLDDVWKLQLFVQVCLQYPVAVECPASLRCYVPSLTNGMKVMPVFPLVCFFLRSNSIMWASSRKTVSWRHLYLP